MVRGNLVISNGDISHSDIIFSDGDLNYLFGEIFVMFRKSISQLDFGITVLIPYHQAIFISRFDYHHLRYHHLAPWQTSYSHVTCVTCDSDTPLFEKMWQGSDSDTLVTKKSWQTSDSDILVTKKSWQTSDSDTLVTIKTWQTSDSDTPKFENVWQASDVTK